MQIEWEFNKQSDNRQDVYKRQDDHGLEKRQLQINNDALLNIIRYYTRESGVRNLNRELAKVARKAAKRIAEGTQKPVSYTHLDVYKRQVHDPIYQGAGAMGIAGIPQPKPGAVTKAHGGILFIDEIGELHPIQINKLLKVLEDRKVILESAYYSPDDPNIPSHIHDIFQKGLPADFRLIAATTRMPQEIPPAIRSRCVETVSYTHLLNLLTPARALTGSP